MSAKKTTLEHVGVRIDKTIVARIEALAPLFSTTGRDATLSDMLRIVIMAGLERFERDPEGTKRELMSQI
jgi:hypothetical protein